MSMRNIITAFVLIAVAIAVTILTATFPDSSRALADTPVHTQAYSPAYDSAYQQAYDLATSPAYRPAYTVYTTPDHDQAGEPTCPRGQRLMDTEDPELGDSGIVCREEA